MHSQTSTYCLCHRGVATTSGTHLVHISGVDGSDDGTAVGVEQGLQVMLQTREQRAIQEGAELVAHHVPNCLTDLGREGVGQQRGGG